MRCGRRRREEVDVHEIAVWRIPALADEGGGLARPNQRREDRLRIPGDDTGRWAKRLARSESAALVGRGAADHRRAVRKKAHRLVRSDMLMPSGRRQWIESS